MISWRDEEFAALRRAAAATAGRWPDYAEYCRLRERGERRRSLAALDRFLAAVAPLDFPVRRDLVVWLFEQDTALGRYWELTPWRSTSMHCPRPLHDRLIDPTIKEWIEREPTAAQPRLIVGTVEALRAAYELDPTSGEVGHRLLRRYEGIFDFYLHEMPQGYLGGQPREDLAFLVWARPIACGIGDDERRAFHLRWLDRAIALTKSYADYLADGGPAKQPTFAVWARSRGRPASLGD
jgi:hypothetical protein